MSQKTEDQRPGHRPSWTTERASRYFLSPSFSFSMGLPSVRHSPLPLQSFLPLVVPHPPLPLEEFWSLRVCLSFLVLLAFAPLSELGVWSLSLVWATALVVPATNPVRAAPTSSARIDFVIGKLLFFPQVRWARFFGLRSRKNKRAHQTPRLICSDFAQNGKTQLLACRRWQPSPPAQQHLHKSECDLVRGNGSTNPGRPAHPSCDGAGARFFSSSSWSQQKTNNIENARDKP